MNFSVLLLVKHHAESGTLAEGAWFLVSQDLVNANLAEVLSSAAGEMWVFSHVQTEGILKVLDSVNKLTLIATSI